MSDYNPVKYVYVKDGLVYTVVVVVPPATPVQPEGTTEIVVALDNPVTTGWRAEQDSETNVWTFTAPKASKKSGA